MTVMLIALTCYNHIYRRRGIDFHTSCVADGPYKTPCSKILHFDFNNTYDSDSCYNFAAGDPYGYPTIAKNMLCLNGINQFFSVSISFCLFTNITKIHVKVST